MLNVRACVRACVGYGERRNDTNGWTGGHGRRGRVSKRDGWGGRQEEKE